MKITRRQILTAGAVVALTGFGVYFFFERARLREEGIISFSRRDMTYPDGRDVRLISGGNGNHRTVAVMIFHYGTIDPTRRILRPGVIGGPSGNEYKSMLSTGKIVSHFPADTELSGVWVDGKKRLVTNHLVVTYISEKLTAQDVSIPEADQTRFLTDMENLDPLLFIEKWITPRLLPR